MTVLKNFRDRMDYAAVEAAGPEAVTRFHDLVANGESVSMAAVLATRSPPRTGITDQTYMREMPPIVEQFKHEPEMLELYRRNYKAETGEDLPDDARAFRGLVSHPGDSGFILTHKHSLEDCKRVAKERNLHVEGDWENHQVSQAPTPQSCRMAPMVMDRYKSEYRAESEEYQKLDERELEELILDTHAPIVSPDDVMNAPTTISEAMQRALQ